VRSFFALPLYLNKMRLHKTTVVFLLVFISLTVFYFCTVAGVQSGDYLYYFPLIMAISFAFDFSKDKILLMFIFILVLIIINTFAYIEFPVMAEAGNTRYQMFVVNLFFSDITRGAFVLITAKNNDKVSHLCEQKIKQKEQSEVIIKKALLEKEVLLAELHHRVKNYSAVMVGFF
jgi:hypothetical protein